MRGRCSWILALGALAILVAGCGGSSRLTKAQYEKRVQADGKALTKATSSLGASTTSLAALKTAVTSAHAGLEAAANDLESLKPPKEAEADNKAFVAAIRDIEAQFTALAKAADKGDMNAVIATVQKLSASKAIKAAQVAAADLSKKGYKLGALGA